MSKDSPLAVTTSRNLGNNLYDKRKLGALEVEQLVKELNGNGDKDGIKKVIQHLNTEFIQSSNGNAKKGGLIAFAAIAIGLGKETGEYVEELLPPVLSCFIDQDMRVRYYACESLYNVSKVARGKILSFFNEIFDGLCKLSADPDVNVKNGAQLLDRLVKDIVTEVGTFDVERFVPLLRERIFVVNPFCRMFIVGWLSVLDSVPDIDLLRYLPQLLGGLFNMLQDTSAGIRQAVDALLAEFLREIRDEPGSVDLGSLIETLLGQCSAQDDFTRLTALVYVTEFIEIGGTALMPHVAALVRGVLPSVAHSSDNIAGAAIRANDALLGLVRGADDIEPYLGALLDALMTLLAPDQSTDDSSAAAALPASEASSSTASTTTTTTTTSSSQEVPIPARLAALRWMTALHARAPAPLGERHSELLPSLLESACGASELLARRALELLATLSDDASRLDALLEGVVHRLAQDSALLDNRGPLVVRQLCVRIAPELVLRRLSAILEKRADLDFATVMVDSLNLILLTAPELEPARQKLRGIASVDAADFFSALYRSWAHSPAALLCLCLLCGVYEHSAALVMKFADVNITVGVLMSLDRLIQLLESPCFVALRLQLLEPDRHPFLFKTLYGILMLLPQSAAFTLLQTRLNAVTTLGTLLLVPKVKPQKSSGGVNKIDFAGLLNHFSSVCQQHQKHELERALAEASTM